MKDDQESISESLEDWKAWFSKQLPPVFLFVVAAALGRWLSLITLFLILVGWLFLIILAQLLGARSTSSEQTTSDSSNTDDTT